MKYELDQQSSERLEAALKRMPEQAEDTINQYFKDKGSKAMMLRIIDFMPESHTKKEKIHAKRSQPLKANFFNLGFEIVTKGGAVNKPGSFGYLVFPNDGRGKRNKVAQRFMERGMEAENDVIINELSDLLEQKLTATE